MQPSTIQALVCIDSDVRTSQTKHRWCVWMRRQDAMRAGAASTGCCTSTSAGYHCQPVHISRLAQLPRPARAQRLVCVSDRAARHAVLRLLGCQRPCRSARRVQALPPRSESDAETDVQSVDAGGSLDEAVPSIWKVPNSKQREGHLWLGSFTNR